MKVLALFLSLFFLSCKTSEKYDKSKKIESYSLDATENKSKIYIGKQLILNDDQQKKILAINGNLKFYADNESIIIDTLNKNLKYDIIIIPDSIKKYSNSNFIKKVILIHR